MSLHIAFDVDGTLDGFHGPVTVDLCNQLRAKGAKLWLLSRRDDPKEAQQIRSKYHLRQVNWLKGENYIAIKRSGLLYIQTKMLPDEKLVYVGDRAEDFVVALMTNATYCTPDALSDEIFDEAKIMMAVLCGGDCGSKQFFEGKLGENQ